MREPAERLKKKVQRENLWIFILNIICKKERYAYEIRELVRKQHGFLAGNVTAYKVLYLLEKGGYVKSQSRGNKTYYTITKKGKYQLRQAKKFFSRMLRELE